MKNWNLYKMGFWASFASNKRPIPNSSSISKVCFTSNFDLGVFFPKLELMVWVPSVLVWKLKRNKK
jgi:hypothetical protein